MALSQKQTTLLTFATPLVAALLVRLLLLAFWEHTVVFDGEEYVKLGLRIAGGAGFVDDAGAPYIFRAPGFPYLLGWIYSLFGASKIASGIVLLFLEFLTVPMIAVIATRIGGTIAGVRTAWIWGLQPFSAAIALAHHSDSVALLLLAIVWLIVAFRSDKIGWLLVAGIMTGALALVRPIFQVFPLLLWLSVYPLSKFSLAKLKPILLGGLAIAVGYCLVVVPWMIRNKEACGSFSVATQSGTNLFIGWHEGASGGYEYSEKDDIGLPKMNTLAQTDSMKFSRAIDYIATHPLSDVKIATKKITRSLVPLTRDWVLYEPSLANGTDWPPRNQALWLFLLLTGISTTILGYGYWSWCNVHNTTPALRLMSMTIWLSFLSMWVFLVDPRFWLPAAMSFAVFIGIGGQNQLKESKTFFHNLVIWLGVVSIVTIALVFIARRFI